MNKYFFLIGIVLILNACDNNKQGEHQTDNDTAEAAPIYYGWEATLDDSSRRLKMKKVEEDDLDTLSPAAVVAYLNRVTLKNPNTYPH